MRLRHTRLYVVALTALCLCAAAVAAALVTGSSSGEAVSAAPRQSAAAEARAWLASGARQRTFGTPLPMAREKPARGADAMSEIWAGPAAEAYADQAYPHANVDFAQVQAALEQAKGFAKHGDSLKADWDEVGPFTLDVARTPNPNNPLGDVIGGTQDNGTLAYSGAGPGSTSSAVTAVRPESTPGRGTSATTRTSTPRAT